MLEFELPILPADTPVSEAFAPMIVHERSGIVTRGGSEARIVTFGALEKALKAGVSTLADVTESEPALVVAEVYPKFSNPGQLTTTLSSRKFKYGVLQGSYLARILSVSEGFATVYLATPPGFKCKNPNDPHYYPPNRLKSGSKQCVQCGYSV